VLSTGDELVSPYSADVSYGKIRDSNKAMLMTLLKGYSCEIEDLGTVSDNYLQLDQRFQSFNCDIIVTTGGVSMGSHDLIKPYLNEKGKVFFGRLNMKPGKPTTFARLRNTLVFGLPGNPTSAFVTAKLFIPLALSTMQS